MNRLDLGQGHRITLCARPENGPCVRSAGQFRPEPGQFKVTINSNQVTQGAPVTKTCQLYPPPPLSPSPPSPSSPLLLSSANISLSGSSGLGSRVSHPEIKRENVRTTAVRSTCLDVGQREEMFMRCAPLVVTLNRHSPIGMPRVERNQGRLFRALIVSRRLFRGEARQRRAFDCVSAENTFHLCSNAPCLRHWLRLVRSRWGLHPGGIPLFDRHALVT